MSAVRKQTGSGKSSRRRRPKWTELLAALGFAIVAWGQPNESSNSKGDAALDRFLADVRSLSADFSQQLWTDDQRLLQSAKGTLALKRPNRFRWTYTEPDEQLVVTNGEELWMYDVELAQVTVAPLENSAASSPAALLSGDRAVRDQFEVVRTSSVGGLDWVELEPKVEGGDFTSVLIGFKDGIPERLELVDGLNQITRIELSNVVVNPDVSDTAFDFEPPAGVDVIGGDG